MDTPTKRCRKCGNIKPLSEFHRNRTSPDGYHHYCKPCKNAFAKESNTRHRDHVLEYHRQYRQRFPDKVSEGKKKSRLKKIEVYKAKEHADYRKNRERIIEYQREYQRSHREQVRHKKRERYHNNREKYNERQRQRYHSDPSKQRTRQIRWNKKHPDKVQVIRRAYGAKRRARIKQAEGIYSAQDINRIYKAQKGRCYWCGCKVGKTYHVDHVIPLSKGGSNSPENLVIACPHCNDSKGAKLPHEWEGNGGKLL